MYVYVMGTFMYKYHNGELPIIFRNMFTSNVSIHSHDTRQLFNYHVPKCKTDVMKRSPVYQCVIIWNGLDPDIRVTHSYNMFKKALRNKVLHSSLI